MCSPDKVMDLQSQSPIVMTQPRYNDVSTDSTAQVDNILTDTRWDITKPKVPYFYGLSMNLQSVGDCIFKSFCSFSHPFRQHYSKDYTVKNRNFLKKKT